MSDPVIIAEITDVLRNELAIVTHSMIEAGSRAAEAVSVEVRPDGKRRPRHTSEAQYMAAIWTAMLAAKLGERA